MDEQVYDGLSGIVGSRRIGRFIEGLMRPSIVAADLTGAYALMAADEARDAEARDWADALFGDGLRDSR